MFRHLIGNVKFLRLLIEGRGWTGRPRMHAFSEQFKVKVKASQNQGAGYGS